MSVIDDLIYDRTQADVDRVKELKEKILTTGLSSLTNSERNEYMAGMKGAYNASDLNRVGQAVAYIAEAMIDMQDYFADYREARGVADDAPFDPFYPAAEISVVAKQTWTLSDVPSQAQVADYLADLSLLRRLLPVPDDAPEVPADLDGLTYVTANEIEYLLHLCSLALDGLDTDIQGRIDRAADAFVYAAEVCCGE